MSYNDRFRDDDRRRWTEERSGPQRERGGSSFGRPGGSGQSQAGRSDFDRNQSWERGGDWSRGEGRGDNWGGSRGGDREAQSRGDWSGGNSGRGRSAEPVAPEYGRGPTRGGESSHRDDHLRGSSGRFSEDRHGFGSSYGRSGYGDRDRGEFGRDQNDDRGFFDRASDEVASWFGDDEAERRRRMDAREEHRGRGPKGYRRSDERVREDLNDRLTDDPHIDASDIDVTVENGEVTLNGTVRERFAKRHAEDIAESVSGVTHVQNNLRVQQHQQDMGSANRSSSSSLQGGNAGVAGTGATPGLGSSTGMGSPETGSTAGSGRRSTRG